jgi:hypothetical protein
LRTCVISFGSLTEKRNAAGVDAAHLAYVAGACHLWNDELISAHRNTCA